MRSAVVLALAAGGALVAHETTAAPGGPIQVAGIGIGMSVPAAVAALRAAGWTVSREPGRDWSGAIADEMSRQRGGNGIWQPLPNEGPVNAVKGYERVGIAVRPSARGGEIESVGYSAPFAGRSVMEMGRQLFDRYGPSSKGRAGAQSFFLTWCRPVACANDSVRLTAETGGSENRLRLTLFWSYAQHASYDRMLAEAVRARSGSSRPSF